MCGQVGIIFGRKRRRPDERDYLCELFIRMLLHSEERGPCLLYTSDAADDLLCVDLGGRRIIKKKNHINKRQLSRTDICDV